MTQLADDTELAMLRDFYTKWAKFHSVPRDKYHRRQQEAGAQEMVDAARVLAEFYRVNVEEAPKAERGS